MVKTFCVTYKLHYVLHLVLERKTVHIAPKSSGQGSPRAMSPIILFMYYHFLSS